MANQSIASKCFDLLRPSAEELGLILWDVRYVKEGQGRYLRIIIDKDGGVGMEDCVSMSRAAEAILDETDPIPDSYNLQVQSPGLERDISRPEHFARYLGQSVKLKLHAAYEGQKVFCGELSGYDPESGSVTIELPDGTGMTCEPNEIAYVRADDDIY